ncbi:MAG: sterol desaturase family protein [Limnohabitans sp.]|jgi:sterol desaturase/sphingolipid hydroxylase (fatty acid hydroxylase superfamily)|nr:sterol desaturase family protein [Burkholderiales bacterium]
MNLFDSLVDAYVWVQLSFFESVVQPLAFAWGAGNLLDKAYDGTGWLLVGLLQVLVLVLVIGPLERWRPVEPVQDAQAVKVDVLYTLIHRLGLFKLMMFFSFENILESIFGNLRAEGFPTFHLDALWPGVSDGAVFSFILYLIVFDFANYWVHRAQHGSNAWWALHSLHHSQRQMTMWSDNRNHVLDDVVTTLLLSMLALLIGVGPGQFVALVALSQLSESLQHANFKCSFGFWGDRLWVSPRFHRLHHSIGVGHETQGPHTLGGHNFGVLLPCWDMLFKTASFQNRYDPTGVRDQVEQGRDYGRGFWAQQKRGLQRLFQS